MKTKHNFFTILPAYLAYALLLLCFNAQAEIQADVDHEVITIWSEGVRLEGYIYKPKGLQVGDKLPGILLVHGWGGDKAHLQRAYGPQFAKLGFIVLAFDYKGWGKSDGMLLLSEPQLVKIISLGDSAPINAATLSLAASMCFFTLPPKACMLDGLPQCS